MPVCRKKKNSELDKNITAGILHIFTRMCTALAMGIGHGHWSWVSAMGIGHGDWSWALVMGIGHGYRPWVSDMYHYGPLSITLGHGYWSVSFQFTPVSATGAIGHRVTVEKMWNELKADELKRLRPITLHSHKLNRLASPSARQCLEIYKKPTTIDRFTGKVSSMGKCTTVDTVCHIFSQCP